MLKKEENTNKCYKFYKKNFVWIESDCSVLA